MVVILILLAAVSTSIALVEHNKRWLAEQETRKLIADYNELWEAKENQGW